MLDLDQNSALTKDECRNSKFFIDNFEIIDLDSDYILTRDELDEFFINNL